jgi:hypothetical protein
LATSVVLTVLKRKSRSIAATAFWLSLLTPVIVQAAGAISQGFATSSSNIAQGTLLSLVSGHDNTVEPADSSNTPKLVGVANSKPLLELSATKQDNVPVVVSGSTQALVSNINGAVMAGDKITASPIFGIGMKATKSGEVIGTAQANLASVQTVSQRVTKSNGQSAMVRVGLLPIEVNVAYYSVPQNGIGTIASFVPPALQSLADTVSGRQVSPLKALAGTVALVLGFVTVAIMLYSSIRANIASIGRNPLAQHALRKGFIDVVIAALGILAISVVATYIILIA